MSKFVTVPSQYAIFEVPDETFEVLPTGMKTTPPQIVLEVMVMNGMAKRIGTVQVAPDFGDVEGLMADDGSEEEDPPEGAGPWVEDS